MASPATGFSKRHAAELEEILVKVFSKASGEQKGRAHEYLTRLDITNGAAYKELK